MSALLDYLLHPIDRFLNDPSVEEICVQSENEAWVYARGEFTRHDVPDLDADRIEEIAWAAAAQRHQDIDQHNPILDTDLRGSGRLSAVVYPCVERGKSALTIRRGGSVWPTLEELAERGLFDRVEHHHKRYVNPLLLNYYQEKRFQEFLSLAVAENMNILGCGLTAAGKTFLMRAEIRAIPDPKTRVITIQDTAELIGLERFFPNSVQLYYDSNRTDGSGYGAARLVQTAMRMRPGKLILQEVRDGQAAVSMVVAMQTGHTGFTTIHASHCLAAFDRLRFAIKQTEWGAAISDDDLMRQLHDLVDVVVHSTRNGDTFSIDEVWFRHAVEGRSAET